jgi:uncharacterized membrane protein
MAGWSMLAFIWIITLYFYRKLPGTIPTHFNAAGTADDFGPRSSVFFLPALGTVLFIGMSILNRFPHIFNYPVKITPENALRQYTMATRMIRVLKLSVLIVFTLITWLTGHAAISQAGSIGAWLMPAILILVFAPVAYYIVKSFRDKKQ